MGPPGEHNEVRLRYIGGYPFRDLQLRFQNFAITGRIIEVKRGGYVIGIRIHQDHNTLPEHFDPKRIAHYGDHAQRELVLEMAEQFKREDAGRSRPYSLISECNVDLVPFTGNPEVH
ncbi:MAG: hypothetical protein ACP5NS_01140 [Candidatus Pacearchaeota archaeon]